MIGPWDRVQAARAQDRPTARDFIDRLLTGFIPLRGDKRFGEDLAVLAGAAYLNGRPLMVAALERGRSFQEKIEHNFGMAQPEGYRKTLRCMQQAEKFHLPLLCLVDTSGAYPGIGAEERGQGEAIAENLITLMGLRTPVVSLLIGEGGSGGALALAVADRVWMLENAWYSVISPEGCASILWKDPARTKEAAESLHLTAQDLYGFQVIERIFPEDDTLFPALKEALEREFLALSQTDINTLLEDRYAKYRKLGAVLT